MAGPYGFVNDAANYISSVPNKVINLFKSDDAPGDYSSRKASLARQQKLADALTQMGAQEQAVSSAGGIIAPVSPMGALARGLTSFGGSYLSGKAAGDEAALKKEQKEAAQKEFQSFYKLPDTTGLVVSSADAGETKTPVTAPAFAIPGSNIENQAVTGYGMMPNIPKTEFGTIPGRATTYPERMQAYLNAVSSGNEETQKMLPVMAQFMKPEREAIGARGMIERDPFTGEERIVGAPTEKPIDQPTSVDEFNFAKTPSGGDFKGSYTDWLKTKTGATTRITVDGGRRDFSLKTGLRKEFNLLPDVKAFNDVASSYDVISDIANRKQPSPQDDLSLIYSYVKMLDPASVVREGEFATAENSASVPDRIRNAYNKVIQGTRLNSDQRSQYSSAAKGIYESRSRRYNDLVSEYSDYARDAGLDPKEVFRARGKAGPAPAAPVSGTISPRLPGETPAAYLKRTGVG